MIYCNVVINEGCMQNFSILCWKLPPKKLKNWFFQYSAAKKFQNLKILLKKKFRAKKINYIRLIYGVDGCFMQKNFKIGGHTKTLCGFLGLRRRISKNFENWIFSKNFFFYSFFVIFLTIFHLQSFFLRPKILALISLLNFCKISLFSLFSTPSHENGRKWVIFWSEKNFFFQKFV